MIDNYKYVLNKLTNSLWTGKEFDDLLLDLITKGEVAGIIYEVQKKIGHEIVKYIYGKEGSGKADNQESIKITEDINIDMSFWYQEKKDIKKYGPDIVKNFINVDFFDDSLLPLRDKARGEIQRKSEATVERYLESGKQVAIFMLDLDKLKEVNDKNDHEVGGSVIREFANILFGLCKEDAIVLHKSGDEFNIIMPYSSITEVIKLASNIREKAKAHKYEDALEIDLTAAQGICLIQERGILYREAVLAAENAYFPKSKNAIKQRDSIRMVCCGVVKQIKHGIDSFELAYSLVKSNIGKKQIFCNPYLDYLSELVEQEKCLENIQDIIDGALEWINPHYTSGIRFTTALPEWDCKEEFSIKELLFSVMHGLYNNFDLSEGNLDIEINENGGQIKINDKNLFKIGEGCGSGNIYNFKLPDNSYLQRAYDERARRIILIHIGYDKLEISDSLFYRILRVDERPTTGGGLPDFWAATLSELFEYMVINPFVSDVIIFGNRNYAQNLCQILDNINNWEKDNKYSFISRKTNRKLEEIIECQSRLLEHISFVSKTNELIQKIYQIYKQASIWDTTACFKEKNKTKRFLERELSYDSIKLDITDGCRVNNIAEAFPTVLEILRNKGASGQRIKDQAGRELTELINFKIVLNKPSSREIPEYYNEEREILETYFTEVFGTENSLFRKPLEENNQLEGVLQHMANLIHDQGLRYATRRAILVIPHYIEDKDNISPLGLVSIWIAPRKVNDETILDFTYTWRTVEAMIGLPFSMYASIKYAENLVDDIRKRASVSNPYLIKLGCISYNAYSLHMFLDDSYLEIVRGVINEATI